MSAHGLRIGLIGPLPPPSGGMANQTGALARALAQEGVSVEVVQTNVAYRPAWIGSVRVVRALFRLVPYWIRLWQVAGRVHAFHVMANSGWAWHLCAAPAVWVGKLRRIPVLVHYHGGSAERFLARSSFWIKPTMKLADRLIVPSEYLQHVFAHFRLAAQVIPNVIDLGRFTPRARGFVSPRGAPHLIVTRNLEPVYDIGTALRALAIIRRTCPGAHMTVAGSGPEHGNLTRLAAALGVASCVRFTGRLDGDEIAALHQEADLLMNPSLADNLPISILEALASGVPVVTTDVGGIPFVVQHDSTALLVGARDPQAMAHAVLGLLEDEAKASRLADAGRKAAQRYGWPKVRGCWLALYAGLLRSVPVSTAAETK